jgi:hypothetical protein
MGTLRFILWTTACVALGIALGTVELGGRTAVQHAERLWKQKAPRLDKVRDGASDLVDDVRKRVSAAEASGPSEQHSASERQAVDQIIARRQRPAAPPPAP